MFFTFAWLGENQDHLSLEEQVPLLFSGEHLELWGLRQTFTILVLDGYHRLSNHYLSLLKAVGFNVIDFTQQCQRLAKAFPHLDRFGRYEMLCFLRWPALASYLRLENIREQVIHVDGDVIFNASLEEVAHDVKGLTFVLQGCPAFITIANTDWLDAYSEHLAIFHRDIEGYSATAWKERTGWEQSHRERWAGYRNRAIISSDQDFISHLIHTNRIRQDSPQEFVKRLSLFYMENPLYFHVHTKLQLLKDSGLSFSSDGNTCYVEGKKIAFWHFQGAFARYVSTALALRKVYYPFRVPNHLESGGVASLLTTAVSRIWARSRRQIYGTLKELNPDKDTASWSFVDIFNRRSFWKKGVFR